MTNQAEEASKVINNLVTLMVSLVAETTIEMTMAATEEEAIGVTEETLEAIEVTAETLEATEEIAAISEATEETAAASEVAEEAIDQETTTVNLVRF